MFIPHCHDLFDSFFGNGHALQDSLILASAFIVERDLQESRREQGKKSGDNVPERSKLERLPFRA